ncbi:hypothetical protein AAG589_20230 [Isoptericola sp. F-RaC21]|uniref:hypothetical protein n=1 Tax=Isoptericola sp. F-RaC21 TaxID=3141452 RepID=UPI00315C194E
MRPPFVAEHGSSRARVDGGPGRHVRPLHRPAPARRLPPASVRRRHRTAAAPAPRHAETTAHSVVLAAVAEVTGGEDPDPADEVTAR